MGVPHQTGGPVETLFPASHLDRTAIRNQLERILASPLFRNSRRYTNLLRFIVENTLDGKEERLKERCLGVEVFQRPPDYDTHQDPVVRTSAVEIRKRLAQYYLEVAHESEPRIALPPGSYVPEFRPAPQPAPAGQDRNRHHAQVVLDEPVLEARPWSATGLLGRRYRIALAVVALVLAGSALAWSLLPASRDARDRFWTPVLRGGSPVILGVSGGSAAPLQNGTSAGAAGSPETLSQLHLSGQARVPIGDVIAAVHIGGYLQANNRPFRVQFTRSLQLDDLKAGPAVFVGPINRWVQMLGDKLRFTVLRDDAVTLTWISDRLNPSGREWSVEVNAPVSSVAETYALVTRLRHDTTGQMMVSVSGLSEYASAAAGQFLSSRSLMDRLTQTAPRGWENKDLQLVIGAKRVGTSFGTPGIVAVHVW